jgi:hypothetical protein
VTSLLFARGRQRFQNTVINRLEISLDKQVIVENRATIPPTIGATQ